MSYYIYIRIATAHHSYSLHAYVRIRTRDSDGRTMARMVGPLRHGKNRIEIRLQIGTYTYIARWKASTQHLPESGRIRIVSMILYLNMMVES
jgi:hypothetical protein